MGQRAFRRQPTFDQTGGRARHSPRTMYGWLLRGKGFVIFWRLAGCGLVFGVRSAAWMPRTMMNVRVEMVPINGAR